VFVNVQVTSKKKYIGYVAGLQDRVPIGMPAVIPAENQSGIDFTEDMQVLSYEVMYSQNNLITPELWTKVFTDKICFTDENGFGMPGDPRANFILGKDLDKPLPKLMKGIIHSWNFYRGIQVGDKLRMTPGIHAIDANKMTHPWDIPTVSEVIERNLYFEAVNNDPHHSPFNQGRGGKVCIAFFLKWENDYPWDLFTVWDSNQLPQVSI